MSAENKIENNVLSVVTRTENNLGEMDETQSETFGAMTAMYSNLKNNNDARVNEMRTLFHLPSSEAKEALRAISSNASAKNMAAVQSFVRAAERSVHNKTGEGEDPGAAFDGCE